MKAMLVLLVGTLAACQSWQAHAPEHPPPHRGAETGAGTSGSAGSGTTSGGGETADIESRQHMCELSRRITNAHTPDERQALMEQAMPDMSQELRERHLQMMGQGCE
jgi:hypothetical protein